MIGQNGGNIRLHSRLFAQRLDYTFPRECLFPHNPGTLVTSLFGVPVFLGSSWRREDDQVPWLLALTQNIEFFEPSLPSHCSTNSPNIDSEITQHLRVIEIDGLIDCVTAFLQQYPTAVELVSTDIATQLPDDNETSISSASGGSSLDNIFEWRRRVGRQRLRL